MSENGGMTRRSFVAVSGAVAAAAMLPSRPARAAEFEYKMGHSSPAGHPFHKRLLEVSERIDKGTNGRMKLSIFPASQLGQTREVSEAMRLGSGAAGTTGGPAEYASFVRRLGVLGLPFEWKSYEHALRVLDGPVGKELDQDMEKAGFKVLAWATSWL